MSALLQGWDSNLPSYSSRISDSLKMFWYDLLNNETIDWVPGYTHRVKDC